MRSFLLLLLTMLLLPAAFAQGYKPKAGETVLKLEIEGRGDVYIKLYTKEAPKTTAHILALVKKNFYDGQKFHRVETSPKPYLVQFGDPNSKNNDLSGNGGSGERIAYEDSGYNNVADAVGLAHPLGQRDSGDSQFYMLLDKASFLDGNYTVFGKVVAGSDVLKKVQKGDKVLKVSPVEK
ncbi:peptidylprolyl isomerase [Fimbriimonas ginsengisoli]|uniref:Peptidyl-prolyl cis-trans isomerase n=1 Tax=Fimbriimonas ginsengisoli Gsoil 348 TaxID=661478 RepID=A0A068NPI3_FIMGI|nr:peptidylprolyl isomerase [Fimbriimonas ginsengisoli]AIE83489.1 putative peptidyl-prolyl cis-trans isomerase [Fimbriimonas ginsengisoli Gsoil 348]